MKHITYLAVAVLMSALCASVAGAAAPATISYQGYLTDSNGAPINGNVAMTFKLYSGPTVSTALWTQATATVSVTNGVYSAVLGSGTPLTLPFDQPYYLGVTIAGDPELTPRQPLTSVPYALRANTADSVSASGQIVSSLPTGTAPLQVASTTMVPNLNAEMVGGKHAADFVAKTGDTMTGTLTLSNSNLVLSATTATSGVVWQGGSRLMHTYGTSNFFAGTNAGNVSMSGGYNTASGNYALASNTAGGYNTASGSWALANNTTGYSNTAGGSYALVSNTAGNYNTALGASALTSNTTGNYNTAIGISSLLTNSTGAWNTATGMNALAKNTTGVNNTGSGVAALYSNTEGYYNTAIGYNAGSNQTFGYNNIYIGANVVGIAGESNITRIGSGQTQAYIAGTVYADGFSFAYPTTESSGMIKQGVNRIIHTMGTDNFFAGLNAGNGMTMPGSGNTGIGQSALFNNSTGSNNTACGVWSLLDNTSGSYNSAYGAHTLEVNSGNYNTATGSSALSRNSSGSYNVANGFEALLYNTVGVFNTANGASALSINSTGINNTADGYQSLQKNTTGGQNTASGSLALQNNTTGQFNVAMGYAAGVTASTGNANTTGSNNTFLGANSGPGTPTQLTNATAIGANAIVNASNSLVLGANAVKVGIGTTTPDATLDAANIIRVLGLAGTTWPSTGKGLELAYNNTNGGYIQAYDRGGSAWGTLDINASTVNIGGSPGNLHVSGTLSKTAGSFKIDHPLDPRNKYLYHSFVESPDMKNIYDGVVTTDDQGYAAITLPDWFEALNRDFRYQLTVIGQFSQAIVAEKIAGNRFSIRTDKPNVEVSWQVTGIRKDAYAEAHRIPVEEEKRAEEKGTCMHSEACAK